MKGLCLVLAACGAGPATRAPDAAPPSPACTATYAGNVAGVATSTAPCATLTDSRVSFAIPTTALDAPLAVAIELGTIATVGSWTSATVPAWSASGTRTVDHKRCTYSAGNAAAPHGAFALTLTDATAANGTLIVETAVLAEPFANCGEPVMLTIELAF